MDVICILNFMRTVSRDCCRSDRVSIRYTADVTDSEVRSIIRGWIIETDSLVKMIRSKKLE